VLSVLRDRLGLPREFGLVLLDRSPLARGRSPVECALLGLVFELCNLSPGCRRESCRLDTSPLSLPIMYCI